MCFFGVKYQKMALGLNWASFDIKPAKNTEEYRCVL